MSSGGSPTTTNVTPVAKDENVQREETMASLKKQLALQETLLRVKDERILQLSTDLQKQKDQLRRKQDKLQKQKEEIRVLMARQAEYCGTQKNQLTEGKTSSRVRNKRQTPPQTITYATNVAACPTATHDKDWNVHHLPPASSLDTHGRDDDDDDDDSLRFHPPSSRIMNDTENTTMNNSSSPLLAAVKTKRPREETGNDHEAASTFPLSITIQPKKA
eukprot:scaffold3040_cov152-Amphora_coffeaeformis.AAC.1